jgi:hypothetical protein
MMGAKIFPLNGEVQLKHEISPFTFMLWCEPWLKLRIYNENNFRTASNNISFCILFSPFWQNTVWTLPQISSEFITFAVTFAPCALCDWLNWIFACLKSYRWYTAQSSSSPLFFLTPHLFLCLSTLPLHPTSPHLCSPLNTLGLQGANTLWCETGRILSISVGIFHLNLWVCLLKGCGRKNCHLSSCLQLRPPLKDCLV